MRLEVRVSHAPHEGCTSFLVLYLESASVKKNTAFIGLGAPFFPLPLKCFTYCNLISLCDK